jgi:hypothetical protein
MMVGTVCSVEIAEHGTNEEIYFGTYNGNQSLRSEKEPGFAFSSFEWWIRSGHSHHPLYECIYRVCILIKIALSRLIKPKHVA